MFTSCNTSCKIFYRVNTILNLSFLINIFQSYVIVQFLKRGTFNSCPYFLRCIMLTDSIFLTEKSVEKLVINHIRIIKERSFESNATTDSSKDIFVTKDLQEKLSVSLYVCLFVSFKTFAILNTAFFERIFKFISQMLIAHYQNCEQRMPHFDNKYVKKSKMLKIWQILSYIRTMLHTYRMFHKKILQQLQ